MAQRMATYVDSDPQGCEAGRPADPAADYVRAGDHPQDRQGPRPDNPAVTPPAGGSGDRVDLSTPPKRHGLQPSTAGPALEVAADTICADGDRVDWVLQCRRTSSMLLGPHRPTEAAHDAEPHISMHDGM